MAEEFRFISAAELMEMPLKTTEEMVEERPEAKVLVMMMAAAVDVVGTKKATEIWQQAAKKSVYDYGRQWRQSWCRARGPFTNHPPNCIEFARRDKR